MTVSFCAPRAPVAPRTLPKRTHVSHQKDAIGGSTYRTSLTRFLKDGRLCMSNNAAERALAASQSAGGTGPSPTKAVAAPPPSAHSSRPPYAARGKTNKEFLYREADAETPLD